MDINEKIRGVIYIPARDFNAAQMWKNYNPIEIRRDLGYAKSINLNALRVWLSYEYWCIDPKAFQKNWEDFLLAAKENDLVVMPSLFEDCGVEPNEENLWTTDPLKAYAINSPHKQDIVFNSDRWEEVLPFLDWFMKNYKDEEGLLAIEVSNEPRIPNKSMEFTRFLFKHTASLKGNVPLTMGCCNLLDNLFFEEYGIDALQYHDNFPNSKKEIKDGLKIAERTSKILNKPIWLSEAQRVRSSASGFDKKIVTEDELPPAYATFFPELHETTVGFFFWGLMVKPAYLPGQRGKGTWNGLFWEDGSVYSLEDAKAIAADENLNFKEKSEYPTWGPDQNYRAMIDDGAF